MAVAFDMPSKEQPPSPQTKMGYFSSPPRSAGRKIVPSAMPGSEFVSTTTSCGPLPEAWLPAAADGVQVPLKTPPLPAPPEPWSPPVPTVPPTPDAAPPSPDGPPPDAAPPDAAPPECAPPDPAAVPPLDVVWPPEAVVTPPLPSVGPGGGEVPHAMPLATHAPRQKTRRR